MNKELIGLDRYLYTYPLKSRRQFMANMSTLSETGEVQEVLVNNRLAFEYKQRIIIWC